MRKIAHIFMLATLVLQTITGPVVSAVDASSNSLENSTLSEMSGSSSSTEMITTSSSPESASEMTTTESASETSISSQIVPETVLEVTKETPLTEVTEVSREALLEKHIQPEAFVSFRNLPALPIEADGSKVDNYSLKWLTDDSVDDGKLLNLLQKWTDDNLKSVRFQLSFSLSGTTDYEPGSIQIKLPLSVFETRSGTPAGKLSLAVPEAPDQSGIFQYYLETEGTSDPSDDYYIVTNAHTLSAASQGYVQGRIDDLRPHDIKDVATGYTATLGSSIQVTTKSGDRIGREAESLTATVDTFTKIVAASKYGSAYTSSYPNSYPASLQPANPDDYYYIQWKISATVDQNANQPGQITFSDVSSSYADDKTALILGYKVDSDVYTANGTNTVTGQIFDGFAANSTRYATVYVAYPKADFPDIVANKYTVKNSVTFTMIGADDKEVSTATATAVETIHNKPSEPTATVNHPRYEFSKSGLKHELVGLQELAAGDDLVTGYSIRGHAYPYSFTQKTDEETSDSYTIEITDNKVYLDNRPALSGDDFEFSHILFTVPTTYNYVLYDQAGNGWYGSDEDFIKSGNVSTGSYGYKTNTDVSKNPIYTVTGKTASGDYKVLATVDFTSGKVVITPQNGATANDSRLDFPSGITEYKVVIATNQAAVEYNFEPYVRLKATKAIKEYVAKMAKQSDDPFINVYNQAQLEVVNSSGSKLKELTARGGISLYEFRVKPTLSKWLSYVNDPINKNVTLRYTSEAEFLFTKKSEQALQEAITKGYYKEEKSATWYDLLPVGVVPNVDTIKGRSKDIVKNVTLVKNYKNTGRTLMIVEMVLTPDYRTEYVQNRGTLLYDKPKITFEANYSWTSLQNNSTELTNVIAYESANDTIGTVTGYVGEPDDPTTGNHQNSKSAVGSFADLMKDLNPNRDTKSFLYASDRTILAVDTYAVAQLIKEVDTNELGLYSNGWSEQAPKNVYEGGQYTYKLGVANSPSTTSQDLVFYDVLESYTPDSSDADYGDQQWKGIFKSIDVSDLIRLGVKPVVYYSTKKDLVINEGNRAAADVSNTSIWTTTKPADNTTITAIAIDASHREDGTPFVLKENEAMFAYVNMIAPHAENVAGLASKDSVYDTTLMPGIQESGWIGGAHAYNNAILNATLINGGQEEKNKLIIKNYTKVGLLPYRIEVAKTWDDANNRDGLRPQKVSIHLLANGKPTNKTLELSEVNQWAGIFDNLEYSDGVGNRIYYSLVEDNVAGYTFSIKNTIPTAVGMRYNVVNTHVPEKIDIPVTKIWKNDGGLPVRPASIRVNLTANGKLYQSASIAGDAYGNWNYTFKDLYKYDENGREITYQVSEPDYIEGYKSTVSGYTITNTYDPYGDLVIAKTVEGVTEANKQNFFDFQVFIKDDKGQPDFTPYHYETSDGRKGTVQTGESIQLKHNQTATIQRIRSTYAYEVIEAQKAGYTVSTTSSTGVIRSGQENKANFLNTYQAKGEWTIDATKVLKNRNLKAYQFIFDLYDEQGNVVRSGSNLLSGKIAFGTMKYDLKDVGKTYTYTIRERDMGAQGYIYDKHAETVKVKIEDNGNGTLQVTPTYDADGAVFTNTYLADESLELTAWKVMKNNQPLTEGAYHFELRKEGESAVLATAVNGENGKITFSELAFTQADIGQTYTYVANEVVGTNQAVLYDQTTVRYHVTVKDNGDGTLGFDVVMNDDYIADVSNPVNVPTFVNSYKGGSLSIQKNILSGDSNKEFRFKVKLTGPDGSLPTGTFTGTRSKASSPIITFTTLDVTKVIPDPIQLKTTEGSHTLTLPQVSGIVSWNTKTDGSGIELAPLATGTYAVDSNGRITSLVINGKEVIAALQAGYVLPLYGRPAGQAAVSSKTDWLSAAGTFFHTGLDAIDKSLFPRVEAETITPTGEILDSGTFGTVTWELYQDSTTYQNTLYLRPTNGVSGTLGEMEYSNYHRRPVPPWVGWGSFLTQVIVAPGVKANANSSYLFAYTASRIDVTNLDVSDVTKMEYMFAGYSFNSRLTNIIGLDRWNTSKVTNMEGLFSGNPRLTEIGGLEAWNTSEVTNMSKMFYENEGLSSLAIAGWNTSKVTDMNLMFTLTSSLTDIDVSKWNTASVTNMSAMFQESGVNSLVLSGWDTSRVIDMSGMFGWTTNLTNLDSISNWNTSSVKDMSSMFNNATGLTRLDLSNWNVSNVENMRSMFATPSLVEVGSLTNWDTSKVGIMGGMFEGASSLTHVDVSKWNTQNVTDMAAMFMNTSSLINLDVSKWDTSKVQYMLSLFEASGLTSLDLSKWNTSSATDMSGMFTDASNLTDIGSLANWDTSKVRNMGAMFAGASSLTSLNLSGWDTSEVRLMYSMFKDTKQLTDLVIPNNWDLSQVTNLSDLFNNSGVTSLDLSNWDTSAVTNMTSLFANASSLTSLDVSNWTTSSVTDMTNLFNGTRSLTSLDLSLWDTRSLETMDGLFSQSGLTSLDLSNWNTSTVKTMQSAFANMQSLTSLNISRFDMSNVELLGTHNLLSETPNLRTMYLSASTNLAIADLSEPSGEAPYTGKWIREDQAYGPYTAEELMKNYTPVMAGTWVWETSQAGYTLHFDANTGAGSMSNQDLIKDVPYSLPASNFSKFGYRFKGWNTLADGTGEMYRPNQLVTNLGQVGTTITLYAIWEPMNNSVDIQNGEFDITLHGGENWTLSDLPAGTTYEVYEQAESGWVLVQSGATSGTIQSNARSIAWFVNDYQPGKTSYQIGGQKLLDNRAAEGYTFTLIDTATGQVLQQATSTSGGGFTFTPLTYTSEGIYTYEIAEVMGSDSTIQYDSHKETVTITVTDDGTGNLTASSSKANTDIIFHNTKKKGSLTIQKVVTGTTATDISFDITVQIGDGSDIRTISLKNGESQTITDLPYGTNYTVTETNLPEGYRLENIESATGTIDGTSQTVVVQNRYILSGTANISATKKLDVSNDPTRTLKAKEFVFELVDPGTKPDDPSDDIIIATATNDEFGNINFGAVTFTKVGNYRYILRESQGTDTAITYDQHLEEIAITATDTGNGVLGVSIQYDADGAVFTNIINAPEAVQQSDHGSVTISKEVVNLTDANKVKDFDIAVAIHDKDGLPLTNRFAYTSNKRTDGTVANGETIQIRHDENLTIANLPEGAKVSVKELVPPAYQLNSASITMATVVKDTNESIHLINTYTTTGSWKPKGTKKLTGANLSDYQFAFLVLKEGQVLQRVTHNDVGEILFTDIAYSYDDIGKTYEYTIVEDNTGEQGIQYDKRAYTYTVTITDDGDGHIVARTADYNPTNPTANSATVLFENTCTNYPATGSFGAEMWYISGTSIVFFALYWHYKNAPKKRRCR